MARSARSGATGDPPVRRRRQSRSGIKAAAPFLVVLQSHLLNALDTTIVAPLFRPEIVRAEGAISLSVEVNGEPLTLDVGLLANIERRLLRRTVASVRDHDYAIQRALDRLFTGF